MWWKLSPSPFARDVTWSWRTSEKTLNVYTTTRVRECALGRVTQHFLASAIVNSFDSGCLGSIHSHFPNIQEQESHEGNATNSMSNTESSRLSSPASGPDIDDAAQEDWRGFSLTRDHKLNRGQTLKGRDNWATTHVGNYDDTRHMPSGARPVWSNPNFTFQVLFLFRRESPACSLSFRLRAHNSTAT